LGVGYFGSKARIIESRVNKKNPKPIPLRVLYGWRASHGRAKRTWWAETTSRKTTV